MGSSEDERRIVSLLLKTGADINLVNEEGNTPLSSYDLRSSHFSADMKLMIGHITKLEADGLFINQRNIQFMDELIRFWRGKNNNFLQSLPRYFSKCSKEASKLKKESSVLYAFLKENDIDVLVRMWEENGDIRNKFAGKSLNQEKKLRDIKKNNVQDMLTF